MLAKAAFRAIRVVAESEGILFDPTYAGKAMAGMLAAVGSGGIRAGALPVFLHTGVVFGVIGRWDLFPAADPTDSGGRGTSDPLRHVRQHPVTTLLSNLRGNMGTTHLLRLDLERVRRNLEQSLGTPQSEEDVLRLLAALGVRRRDEEWFVAPDPAVRCFLDGEVLEQRTGLSQ